MEQKKDIFDFLKVNKTEAPASDYFENLVTNTLAAKKSKAIIIPLYKKPIVWLTAVAAVLIAVLITNAFRPSDEEQHVLVAMNDLSKSEINKYIEENIDDFDTDLISEFISFEQIEDSNSVKTDNTPITIDELTDEDILEYFNDEGIDIYELSDDEIYI